MTPVRRVGARLLALSGADDDGAGSVRMAEWAQLAEGGFETVEFAGGHFYPVGQEAAVLDAIATRVPTPQSA